MPKSVVSTSKVDAVSHRNTMHKPRLKNAPIFPQKMVKNDVKLQNRPLQ